MSSLNAAIVQFAPTNDKSANLEKIQGLLRKAAGNGANLVVLPEYAVFTVPVMDERFVESAEPLEGSTVNSIIKMASELDIAVIVGVNEVADNNRIHNTLLAIHNGKIQATYRKVHLYDAFGYQESKHVNAANPGTPELFEIGGFRIGMQTCYDLRFPETTRMLVDAGADIVALPSEWVPGPLKEYHWSTLIRARAIENTVYLIAADQCAPTGAGNSAIIDPMGIAIASLGEAEGIASATIEKSRIEHVRTVNPALKLRRYGVVPLD